MNTTLELPGTQGASDSLVGEVAGITFRNDDNGYSVMRVDVRGLRDSVVVVGTSMARIGEIVTVSGRWKMHPAFGRQMEAEQIIVSRPTSAPAIERYLASGVVRGVGPALAKRIVARFGEETFAVLDANPERVGEVSGIGKGKAETIAATWQATQAERAIQVFLAGHNILGALAHRIIRQYGGRTIEVVESTPYRLAKEVRGIGFATADAIAQKLGIPLHAPERIEAGLRHVITSSIGMGHCGIPEQAFMAGACKALSLPEDMVGPVMQRQLHAREFMVPDALRGVGDVVFERRLYDAEGRLARAFASMNFAPRWNVRPEVAESLAAQAEEACGVTLAPEQREAVTMALLRPVSILTGGPGTGKTSTLKVILDALKRVRARVVLGAPTGKAAKRMTESTGFPASTVARLIGMGRGSDEDVRIECDILIVDEASMVDVPMLDRVLTCLEHGATLLLVGDIDQLPSVGAGRVLGDLIESGAVPTTRLTRVFRQAATSAIIRNAHRINRGLGIEPRGEGPTDFHFVECSEPEVVAQRIAVMVSRQIPEHAGLRPQDVQVLSPMRKSITGTEALNALLQQTLNPNPESFVEKFGRRYGVGDRILQTVNNYDLGVMNGESGIIVGVDTGSDTMTVQVDGDLIQYPFADLDQLDLAYAMTVHKSQGSQFPAVVIPLTQQHYMMLQRPIIYTAITRASKFCVVVGQRKALDAAIANVRTEQRITLLLQRLKVAAAAPVVDLG